MTLQQLRCLRGPNRWASCPVVEVMLDLGDGPPVAPGAIRPILERLGCAADTGTTPPEQLAGAFGRLAVRLQEQAGTPVSFSAIRVTDRPGRFLAAVEFAAEPVGQAAVESAWRLLQTACAGRPLSLDEELPRLRDLEYQQRLPASTAVIYHAARARGIPAVRLSPEYGRYLRLGQGSKQHRCLASEPDTIGAVARTASTDKYLAKQLLQAAGVPVPEGRLVATAADAWDAAVALGLPVAMKPQDSDLATGVSLDLRNRDQVEAAFRSASEHSTWVLVERFAPGLEHRVLVVADQVVAVTRIEPPHVVGDGTATVAELVERVNRDPRRGAEGSGAPLSRLKIDDVARAVLAAQGYTLTSVPPAGTRVLVRRNPPYFKNGGNLADLTDHIHPRTAAHAVAAAQVLQLRVAGLDVVVEDISRPLEEQGGVVVEINAGPGLWLHMAPWADSPRPVGAAIVASLFPPGDDGRIPVVAVVGDADGAATQQLTALLGRTGQRVGRVGETGIVIGERHWAPPAATPQERVGVLMQNTVVDVALLETTPRELLHFGFGTDQCAVALVLGPDTGVAADEPGSQPDDCLRALRHALGTKGVLVRPAAGEAARVDAGDWSLRLQGEAVVLSQGGAAPRTLGKCPAELTGPERRGLLAALAAALGLGLDSDALSGYLQSRLP